MSENDIGISCNGAARNNRVYYNTIIDNVLNAEDDGLNNTWDDGISEGNYWSDWDGDGEYEISGYANAVDRYPRGPITPTITTTTTTTTSSTTTTTSTSSTSTTSSSTTTTTQTAIDTIDPMLIASAGVGIAAVIVILIFIKKR